MTTAAIILIGLATMLNGIAIIWINNRVRKLEEKQFWTERRLHEHAEDEKTWEIPQ